MVWKPGRNTNVSYSDYATSWSGASMEKYILITPLGDLENFIDQRYLCFTILQTKPTREFSRSPSLGCKIKIDRREVARPGFPALPGGRSPPQRDSGPAGVPGVQPKSGREGDDRTESSRKNNQNRLPPPPPRSRSRREKKMAVRSCSSYFHPHIKISHSEA